MTLEEIRSEALMLIDEKPQPTTLKILNSGINYGYNKILKEKLFKPLDNLIKDSDVPKLPEDIDHKILAFFGAYYFFKIDGDDEGKGSTWLNMYNDGFENIKETTFIKVESTYNIGGFDD